MSRRASIGPENNFIRGVITETTPLKFPENAATEAMDVMFTNTGRVHRRPGIDFEAGFQNFSQATSNAEVFTEYMWTNASGEGDTALFVVQKANVLHFYLVDTDLIISADKKAFTVDLDSYVPSGSTLDPADYQCSYAQGRGALVVANKAINPIYIIYDSVDDALTVEEIELRVRDYDGLEDGLELEFRPSVSLANLKLNYPDHYYNLLNQGWHASDALTQWDSARTDMPSNVDQMLLYRSSETDSFDNSKVVAKAPGNSPAPKGHFILNALNYNRQEALTEGGFTGVTLNESVRYILYNFGTVIFNTASSPGDFFDGLSDRDTGTAPTVTNQVGKDFGSSPKKIVKMVVQAPNNGYLSTTGPRTLNLKASNTDPATTSWTGTTLGTYSFTLTGSTPVNETYVITSSDQTTAYRYVWLEVNGVTQASEISFYEVTESRTTVETYLRPTHVAFFAGRIFYAGVETAELNSNVYFSQIIERDANYGECYAYNDPTSEYFNDGLATDGGVVVISDMAQVTGLYPFQNALLVFATNGVWLIQGGSSSGFRPSDYAVRNISTIGMNSPKSIVNYRGLPVWWGEDGISTLNYEPNYDSYSVVSLTTDTIRDFYYDIPIVTRGRAKGYYDVNETRIVWLYQSADTIGTNVYDRILFFNPLTKAFYPGTISTNDDVASYPKVRGCFYANNAARETDSKGKFVVTHGSNLTIAEFYDGIHVDWTTYANGNEALLGQYESYFITGYAHHSDAIRNNQVNYLHVFLTQEINGACNVRLLRSYTTTANSGLWGVSQSVYSHPIDDRETVMRRLKLRGNSPVHQFRFSSVDDKPFELIGWVAMESQNANV